MNFNFQYNFDLNQQRIQSQVNYVKSNQRKNTFKKKKKIQITKVNNGIELQRIITG